MVLSSVVERFPDTEEAAGSNPVAPIQINRKSNDFRRKSKTVYAALRRATIKL